ncbi:hypothetical protein BJ166DRAFT_296812 [Pestalotiopsis sp. NC0098]|nr:hypothetical protein BJ166DRAFT_296812 [Pestalotiopsis sp. NC0098]
MENCVAPIAIELWHLRTWPLAPRPWLWPSFQRRILRTTNCLESRKLLTPLGTLILTMILTTYKTMILLREETCENITVPYSSAGSQREHGCNRRYRALPSGRPSVLLSADSSWDFEFLLFHLEPGIWILRNPPGPRGLIQRCVRFPGPEWLRKFFNQRNVGCPAIL